MAQGRQIAELGYVPTVDSWSFFRAQPQPWLNYEWGTDLLFWVLYAWGGIYALTVFKLVLLAVTGVLLVARARPLSGEGIPPWLSEAGCTAVLVLMIPAMRFRLTERPHLFGFLFGALLLLGLRAIFAAREAPHERRRTAFWIGSLALAHVLWVNLHGSHLLGLALTIVHLVPAWRVPTTRKLLATLLGLQLIASCASPFGPAIVTDALAHVFDPRYRDLVTEWGSLDGSDPLLYAVMLGVNAALLLATTIPLARRTVAGLPAALSAALLAIMAARSLRFVAEFMLLAGPLIASGFAAAAATWRPRRAWSVLLAACATALALAVPLSLVAPPGRAFGFRSATAFFPAGSGRFLRARVPGAHLLASVHDAWYLMFAAPNARFLIDGRLPFYGPDHVARVSRAYRSPEDFRRLLDDFHADAVVIEYPNTGQRAALAAVTTARDWRVVMIEDRHALFLKTLPNRAALLERHGLHAVIPAYDPAPLLDQNADLVALRNDLLHLEEEPNARGYVGWTNGMLLLRPFARAEVFAGFHAPTNAQEREIAREALAQIRLANRTGVEAPMLNAYWALAALAACELDEAREALGRARLEEENREAVLTGVEIDLRAGNRAAVEQFLERATRFVGPNDDPWLAAIRSDLATGVTCDPRNIPAPRD